MKCLEVPFFKQETIYTCGPASLRMTLGFFGVKKAETELAKDLGANDAVGTERVHMGEVAKLNGLIPHERSDALLDDLRVLLDSGLPTIVRFVEPSQNTDHYGVVIGMDDEQLIIHDPWNGPGMSYDLGTFFMRWPCQYTRGQTCWMLGVGPEAI